jgi:uncharacterized protein (TIGR02391 family)
MTDVLLENILHKRIIDNCISLYTDNHFSHAAFEAMKQVELALKERTKIKEKRMFGVKLIENIFGSGKTIKLRVPLGEEYQEEANNLFKSSFSYYRNYSAHDGRKINKLICIRIMILASELLDMIGASSICYNKTGGVDGLIKMGIFESKRRLVELLIFLSTQTIVDESYDSIFEYMTKNGYTNDQYEKLFDLGLMEYRTKTTIEKFIGEIETEIEIGWFEITSEGKMITGRL